MIEVPNMTRHSTPCFMGPSGMLEVTLNKDTTVGSSEKFLYNGDKSPAVFLYTTGMRQYLDTKILCRMAYSVQPVALEISDDGQKVMTKVSK